MIVSRSTRLRIEKFVYKKGTNVALYHAEHSDRYIEFQDQVESGLNAQIKYVTNDEHMDSLMMLSKKVTPTVELLAQIGSIISKKPLSAFIDLATYLGWAGEQGGQAAIDKLGVDGIFGLVNQQLLDYFDDYSNLIIKTVDDYTKQWLAQTLQTGKSDGLSPYQIQKMIVEEGKGFSKIRAERIVLTETAKAMTTVELETYRRAGLTEVIWRTSRDDRVCPICFPLDGEKGSVADGFPGGYAGPPAHIMCRCYMEDVIPKDWVLPEKVWLGE